MGIRIARSGKETCDVVLHEVEKLYKYKNETNFVERYRKLLDCYPEALVLAFDDNKLVGCMRCLPVKDECWKELTEAEAESGIDIALECIGDYNSSAHVVLDSLIVMDEYRDTGLAYEIFDRVIFDFVNRAKGGLHIADITCLVTSEDGKKMAERLGFVIRDGKLAAISCVGAQAA